MYLLISTFHYCTFQDIFREFGSVFADAAKSRQDECALLLHDDFTPRSSSSSSFFT